MVQGHGGALYVLVVVVGGGAQVGVCPADAEDGVPGIELLMLCVP